MCCHLTKARSLTFYKAFAVETQRGYSEKWTQGPTDFLEYSLGSCFFFQGFIPINNSKIALATTFRFITSEKLDDEKYAFFKKEMTPFKNVVSDISTELNKIFSS